MVLNPINDQFNASIENENDTTGVGNNSHVENMSASPSENINPIYSRKSIYKSKTDQDVNYSRRRSFLGTVNKRLTGLKKFIFTHKLQKKELYTQSRFSPYPDGSPFTVAGVPDPTAICGSEPGSPDQLRYALMAGDECRSIKTSLLSESASIQPSQDVDSHLMHPREAPTSKSLLIPGGELQPEAASKRSGDFNAPSGPPASFSSSSSPESRACPEKRSLPEPVSPPGRQLSSCYHFSDNDSLSSLHSGDLMLDTEVLSPCWSETRPWLSSPTERHRASVLTPTEGQDELPDLPNASTIASRQKRANRRIHSLLDTDTFPRLQHRTKQKSCFPSLTNPPVEPKVIHLELSAEDSEFSLSPEESACIMTLSEHRQILQTFSNMKMLLRRLRLILSQGEDTLTLDSGPTLRRQGRPALTFGLSLDRSNFIPAGHSACMSPCLPSPEASGICPESRALLRGERPLRQTEDSPALLSDLVKENEMLKQLVDSLRAELRAKDECLRRLQNNQSQGRS